MVKIKCIRCQKIKRHRARNYCDICYIWWLRHNSINYANAQKANKVAWALKNKDYMKKYYEKNPTQKKKHLILMRKNAFKYRKYVKKS